MCGADVLNRTNTPMMPGSSPRVRSRHRQDVHDRHRDGIISACAEQTKYVQRNPTVSKDHLRVCGADSDVPQTGVVGDGSSPRVRSRRRVSHRSGGCHGIISACAEQTSWNARSPTTTRDHLRVCGADRSDPMGVVCGGGSSPRVRSRPRAAWSGAGGTGIISACAEQTPDLETPRYWY